MARFRVGRYVSAAPSLRLQVSPTGRYLIRSTGQPFQIRGSSLWFISQSSQAEMAELVGGIAAKGFNSIIAMTAASETQLQQASLPRPDGLVPFTGSKLIPNETYWSTVVDYLLNLCASLGMVVQLSVLYFGYVSSNDGFRDRVGGCTEGECYAFGQWLGNRYKNFPNIIWVAGGDNYTLWDAKWQAIIDGLLNADTTHLITAHPARGQEGKIFGNWVTLNMSYQTAANVVSGTTAAYANDVLNRPVLMYESHYEGDGSPISNPTLTAEQAVSEAWQAHLSNSCGANFGNHAQWCQGYITFPPFTVPPYLYYPDWKTTQGFESAGTLAMAHLNSFLESINWVSLVGTSDVNSTYIKSSRNSGANYVTGAFTNSLGVIYTQAGNSVDVDLSLMSGPVFAKYIDPHNGNQTLISSSIQNNHVHTFTPPTNSNGGTAMAIHIGLAA